MKNLKGRTCRKEGFCVSPKSEEEIKGYAASIRKFFSMNQLKSFDIVRFIELILTQVYRGFRFEVVEDYELPDREAEMSPSDFCIRVRQSVYKKACELDGHARFTLAHELGHFILHRDQGLAFGRPAMNGSIPAYKNSEWQADTFARHLLVPEDMAKGMNSLEIAAVFDVSRQVAAIVAKEKKFQEIGSKKAVNMEFNF